LQYANEPYMTTLDAVGTVNGIPSSGFAKLCDSTINSMPTDSKGYSYYKITSDGSCTPVAPCKPRTVFVRTKKIYVDTAVSFGWGGDYDFCGLESKESCDVFSKWTHSSATYFETSNLDGNPCNRWYTDFQSQGVNCYPLSVQGKRCFGAGPPCSSMRLNVVISRLSTSCATVTANEAWRPILQYSKTGWTPTPNAVGTVTGIASEGFAKLSDSDINAIPADADGYYYYRFANDGTCDQYECKLLPTVLIRTKAAYVDKAVGFGWAGAYDACRLKTKEDCDIFFEGGYGWKKMGQTHFDTGPLPGQGCSRWYADYPGSNGLVTCNGPTYTGKRCFSSCQNILFNVVVSKWSAPPAGCQATANQVTCTCSGAAWSCTDYTYGQCPTNQQCPPGNTTFTSDTVPPCQEVTPTTPSGTCGAWVPILQYADKPYMVTRYAYGTVNGVASSGFAKLCDSAINAMPTDANGYAYYKLSHDSECTFEWQTTTVAPCQQPTLFVRTRKPYVDTALSFGWGGDYDICSLDSLNTCEIYSAWKHFFHGLF
jgi:hypothetical protein